MEFRQQRPVSEHMFRTIFNTEFNLSFKRRHTDTCKVCDECNSAVSSGVVPNAQKETFKLRKEEHLQLVQHTNQQFKNDVENAANSSDKSVVLTFDLQKTLETPSITTSVAFYKRVLWTYNLCVFDEVNKKGSFFRNFLKIHSKKTVTKRNIIQDFTSDSFLFVTSVYFTQLICICGAKMWPVEEHKKWPLVYLSIFKIIYQMRLNQSFYIPIVAVGKIET